VLAVYLGVQLEYLKKRRGVEVVCTVSPHKIQGRFFLQQKTQGGENIPPIRSVFQVTHTDPRSYLMMADYC
jgi:hypothetical protein